MQLELFIEAYKLYNIYPTEFLILQALYDLNNCDKKLNSYINNQILQLKELHYTGDDTLFGEFRTKELEELNLIKVKYKNSIIQDIRIGDAFVSLLSDKKELLKELFLAYPKISKSGKPLIDFKETEILQLSNKYFESIEKSYETHKEVLNYLEQHKSAISYTFKEFISHKIWLSK